jgi:hypothetical protein
MQTAQALCHVRVGLRTLQVVRLRALSARSDTPVVQLHTRHAALARTAQMRRVETKCSACPVRKWQLAIFATTGIRTVNVLPGLSAQEGL